MRWKRGAGLLGLAFALLPSVAAAAPSTAETMDSLVIEGDPSFGPPGAGTQSVTSIDVAKRRSRVESVSEVLREAAGVQIRDFGGLGAFSTLSIRGSNANQVRILVDGVPIEDPLTGALNVNDFRLDNLAEIEVYRGFTPIRFGSPTLGGAVNLVTAPIAGTRREVVFSYGSFDTVRGSVFASHQDGLHGFAAAFNAFSTEGDFRFLDDNGTPFNLADDTVESRRNNDRLALGGLLKYQALPAGWPSIDASVDVFHKDEGVPGIGSFQADRARFEKTRILMQVGSSGYGFVVTDLETSLRLFHAYEVDSFSDPEGEIGTGVQDTGDHSQRAGIDTLAAFHGVRNSVTSFTLRLTGQRLDAKDEVALTRQADGERGQIEAAVEEEYSARPLGLVLVGNVSVEHARTRERGPGGADRADTLASPRLGARWDAAPGFSLFANGGRFYRQPTFLELFGNTGTILGNPDLEPEVGWSFDLGARYQLLPVLFTEVTGFYRETRDLIVFEQNSQRTSIAQNVSRARALGVEVTGRARIRRLELQGSFTAQDLEDRSATPFLRGNDLPGRPELQAFGRATIVDFAVEPFFEVDFTGKNFLDRANLVQSPNRTLLNTGADLVLGRVVPELEGAGLLFEAKNLTDNRILDVAGYPLPGRSFFGSVRYEF